MMKNFNTFCFLLLLGFLSSGFQARADTYFTEGRLNYSYNYLEGAMYIEYMNLEEEGVDDQMIRATLYYQDAAGQYQLLFDRGYSSDWSGSLKNPNVAYVSSRETNDITYLTFKWTNIPANLLGRSIRFAFSFDWDIDDNDSWNGRYDNTFYRDVNAYSIDAPGDFNVGTNECNKVRLSWANPDLKGAAPSNYTIYVYRNNTLLTNDGLPANRTSFDDLTAEDGVNSYYYLKAYLKLGNTYHIVNTVYKAGSSTGQPGAPLDLRIVQDPCRQKVNLSWALGNKKNLDKFILERSTSSNFSNATKFTFDANSDAFGDENLKEGTTYYYRLKALNKCDEGPFATGSVVPNYTQQAVSIRYVIPASQGIYLAWDNLACYNPAEVKIEKRNQESGTVETITLENNAIEYYDKDALLCVPYRYKLFVKQSNTNKVYISEAVFQNLTGTISDALLSLEISKGYYPDKITLAWTTQKENQIDAYKIFRRPYGGSEYKLVKNIKDGSLSWTDENTDANKYYEYKLVASASCVDKEIQSNELVSVGFRQPKGTVTGQISYSGGTAVQGVKVLANSNQPGLSQGTCLNMDGKSLITSSIVPNVDFSTGFTIESWVNLRAFSGGIRNDFDQYSYLFLPSTSFVFAYFENEDVNNPGVETKELWFYVGDDILIYNMEKDPLNLWNDNDWNHISLNYNRDTTKIYLNGKVAVKHVSKPLENINFDFEFGQNLDGYMDEIRVWNRSLSDEETARLYKVVASGTEKGLILNYHLDEGIGNFAFDASQNGDGFNGNHGSIVTYIDVAPYTANSAATFSDKVPDGSLLSRHAYTDEVGSYVINGIPYRDQGELFRVTPIFGQHSFDPPSQTRYLGDGSFIQNDVDFTDISSFTVTGRITYRNTDFPVEGVFLKIDGRNAFGRDNRPITSNSSGEFNISVPIGEHYISYEKNGHVFNDSIWPGVDTLGLPLLFDFQEAITNINFYDDTKVLLAGRIVGGTKEGAKKIGFGLSENNIGPATVKLVPVKPYSLNVGTTENNFIEFSNDPKTGEYSQWIIPEEFNVTSLTHPTYSFTEPAFLAKVDLRNALIPKFEIDSVYQETIVDGETQSTFDSSRTFQYHLRRDWIYRSNPSIAVTSKGKNWLSDEVFEYLDQSGKTLSIPLHLPNDVHQFGFPVFKQLRRYSWQIWVFEKYIHSVSQKTTTVDVTDSKITVSNNLASPSNPLVVATDSLGMAAYSFIGGYPNTALDKNNPANSFTLTAAIVAKTSSGKIAKWPESGEYRAYVMGGFPTGNNFVSTGPNKIDFILRDPPGSGSSAKLEKGFTSGKSTTKTIAKGNVGEESLTVDLGVESVTTIGGLGAGVSFKVSEDNNLGVVLEHSENWLEEDVVNEVTTFTESYSTSATNDFVGSDGDVFIGHSTNIVYGESNNLSIANPADLPIGGARIGAVTQVNGQPFTIGIRTSVRVNPTFKTFFLYSQQQIIDNVIPGLKKLRNLFFSNQRDHYKLVFTDLDDEKFATNNDDPLWGAAATSGDKLHNGPSYTFIPFKALAPNWTEDSVRYYNNQIKSWESILADNEQQKLEGKPSKFHSNISFDNGATYEGALQTERSAENTSTFEFTLNPGVTTKLGLKINDVGPTLELKEQYTYSNTATETTNNDTTKTVSFTLSDDDEANYYTVDVLDCQAGNGPIFRTKGGQSSCPYEGELRTQYYQPGTVLNQAMVSIYNPVITADAATQEGVPEDDPAIFRLNLSNPSAVKLDQWFLLKTDNASNPNGAKLFVDGSPLSGSGFAIKIPAGEVITKTLEVYKGAPDSNNYFGIKVQLLPTCDADDAMGEVEIGVSFVPACSRVVIAAPQNNWIANVYNKDILGIRLNRFNSNLSSFKYVALQYKDVASTTWSTLVTYYKKQVDFNTDQGVKELIGTRTTLDYNWNIKDIVDREYELRAITVCVDGSIYESTLVRGIKDTKRPGSFGAPQPSDGVLSAGDEVFIQFDEPIVSGLLLANKQFITAKGVLNGTDIANNTSLEFNGTTNQAIVGDGITLGNTSFTIEAWVRHNANQAGTIWSFGEAAANQLKLAFDASGKLVFSDAAKSYTGTKNYQVGKWYHIALSYDAEGQKLLLFQDDQLDINATVTITSFPVGRMSFGYDLALKSAYYNGRIRDFRIWSRAIPFDVMYARKSAVLSGNEPGLLGYWLMDEKFGALTRDKAHLRHASLNATWKVEPQGKSVDLDGTSYVTLDGRNINIDQETDFTIEFWFNGSPGTDQCLLSSGRGTVGELFNARKSLAIVATVTGIQVLSNGKSFQLSTRNLLDNSWHHLALVVNRRGNTKGFIDGNLVSQTDVNGFGGFGEDSIYLGARRWKTGTNTFQTDAYFLGTIDEVRFWKTARTAAQILSYRNHRVPVNAVGLTGYYPFEKYTRDQANVVSLNFSKADQWPGDKQTLPGAEAVYNGGASTSDLVPNIDLERPVKDLNFDLAVNGDKVLLTLKEPLSLIENCLLEFSIRDATDLHNNILASPVQWSAFVDKNQVKWETSSIKLENTVGQSHTFTAKIRNFGGLAQSFDISNLPAWLTASPASGTLNPLASLEITFTINSALNNGTYNEDVYLASENGVNERLALSLRVFNQAPNWTVSPEDYEYSMNAIGLLRINGLFSRNPNDLVGVFKNGVCRGVANLKYIAQTDQYMVFLDIYGNREDINTDFQVKVWNDNLGAINTDIQIIDGAVVKKAIVFTTTGFLGETTNPVIFSADNTLEQSIPLLAGWNWISFNLTTPKQLSVGKMFESLRPSNGDIVKSLSLFEEYATTTGWFGAISASGGFDNVSMYQLKTAKKDTLVYSGIPLVPSNIRINISSGWNWIGYTPTFSMPVEDALANLNPLANDIIKGQRDFAIFDKKLGWIGSLKSLKSTAGYKYFSKDPKAKFFTYPNRSFFAKSKELPIDRRPETSNHIVPEAYETNMNLVAVVKGLQDHSQLWLLAKIDGKAVGCVAPTEVNGVLTYFNTLFGQDQAEQLSFSLLDAKTGSQIALKERLTYRADQIIGSIQDPFVFELGEVAVPVFESKLKVWPQPFAELLNVSIEQKEAGELMIELYDLSGRNLGVLYQGIQPAGHYELALNTNTDVLLNQPAGVYSLRVVMSDAVQTKVVIKQ